MKVPLALALAALSYAQVAPDDNDVAMGHIHLNVSSIDAQTKFWVQQFDATPIRYPGLSGVKVPGMLILFNQVPPMHPSSSTVLDHFGFKVRNRDEMVKSCRAAGYTIAKEFIGSEGFPNAYVVGPDGINVELQQDTSLKVRAVAQHLHFLLPDPLPLRAWYIETFHMRPSTRGPHDSADIPGMNLTFAPSHARTIGTKGGIIDHIAFEVQDLAVYSRKLGIPLATLPGHKFSSLFLTDPAGVLIELTQGLPAATD